MEKQDILRSDLLDIIFEKRNKAYGAYTLRKYYNKRLYKALGIIFSLISVLVAFGLLYKPTTAPKYVMIDPTPGTILREVEITKKEKPVPQKPLPQAPQKPVSTATFVSSIKVVDNDKDATKLAKNLDSVAIGTETTDIPGNNKTVVKAPEDPGPVTVNTTPVVVPAIDKNTPLNYAEVAPSYPGGTEALLKFLQRNLRNPRDLEEGEKVSVKIMFIVGFDGTLKGFKTIEDGGAEFNNEVIRVLKKMPAWEPGKTAGQNVSVYYTIPVKFIPQE